MINTYCESSLHKTLKNLYAKKYNGKTEENILGKICDVITQKNDIIEIQTSNLSQLYEKIKILIEHHKIKIIYPLVICKYIETYSTDSILLSRRKSPKKNNIYSIFKELTKIYPFLLNENFSLEILEVTITEIRKKTEKPVQLKNKSRRFKKDWIKTDKKLEQIHSSLLFSNYKDYINLLPKDLPYIFSKNDICKTKNDSNYMLWVLKKMNLIKHIKTEQRKKFFILNNNIKNR